MYEYYVLYAKWKRLQDSRGQEPQRPQTHPTARAALTSGKPTKADPKYVHLACQVTRPSPSLRT